MTHSSDLTPAYVVTDADVVAGDLTDRKIAYGASGKIIGNKNHVDFVTDVSLLLHCNGADASTTFIDDSSNAHTVTANGDAQLDTADFKYGTAAALFDGTGDYLSIPYVAGDFDWFAEDYTIEAWIKAASFADWETSSTHPTMIGRAHPTSSTVYWAFGPLADGSLEFYYNNGGAVTVGTSAAVISTGVWTHIAMSHIADLAMINLFVGGLHLEAKAVDGSPASVSESLLIGQNYNVALTGSLDDIRIIKGQATYRTGFIPPIRQHPDS